MAFRIKLSTKTPPSGFTTNGLNASLNSLLKASQIARTSSGECRRHQGGKRAFHMELSAIEHIKLENECRLLRIESLAEKVLLGLFEQPLDRAVERGVALRELLASRGHEREFLRSLIDVHDVHRGRAIRTKHGRKRKHHGYADVALKALGMGGAGAAANEERMKSSGL